MTRRLAILLAAASAAFAQELPPTALESYLELTRAQSSAIARNESAFDLYQREKAARSSQVQSELFFERERRPLDPLGFGARYVEIETIRREIEARSKVRATDNRAVLNAEQRAKLPALDEARRLQVLTQQALCMGLLTQPPPAGGSPFPGNIIPVSRISGIAVADPFCSFAAAQLLSYLEFTPNQSRIVIEATAGYQGVAIEKNLRAAQVNRELTALTAAETLDPLEIGLRYVELETIQQELRDAAEQARESLRASLTPAQKDRLQPLVRAIGLQPPASSAECIGLLDPLPLDAGGFSGVLIFGGGNIPGLVNTFCGAVRP